MAKYGNKKTVIDGIKFDSIAESRRYIQLKHLEEIGEISHLRLQPRFDYFAENTLTKAGKPSLLFLYKADFDYCTDDGKYIVEDVKSKFTDKLPVFNLKKKLIEDRHGVEIVEVR